MHFFADMNINYLKIFEIFNHKDQSISQIYKVYLFIYAEIMDKVM